jgi:hydrogenase maturation protease
MIQRIIAVGSPHGDDQIGWAVAKSLQCHPLIRAGIDVLYRDRPGLSLFNDLDVHKPTLLIDAADFSGTPGAFLLLAPNEQAADFAEAIGSSHGYGIQALLALARYLNHPMPSLTVCAIQIMQVGRMQEVSVELTQAVPHICDVLIQTFFIEASY